MGDILPFIAKVRASGDWTAAERARLETLAQQFSGQAAGVEAVFGTTEDGDPWCVVKDAQEDVLIHVARIGGRFVVHYAVEDALEEGADLHAALSERLLAEDDARDDVVVPFSLAGRQAQTFLALVVVAAFFYETQEIASGAEAPDDLGVWLLPEEVQEPPTDLAEQAGARSERELVVNASAMADPAPEPPAAGAWTPRPEAAAPIASATDIPLAAGAVATPAPGPQADPAHPGLQPLLLVALEPARVLQGANGDDLLVGGRGTEAIRGEAGNDTLQGGGAAPGSFDTLDGGAGDDRIELGADVIATGGEGADAFVLQTPALMGDADTLLGVITDFRVAEGDAIVAADGQPAVVSLTSPPPGLAATDAPMTTAFTPQTRIEVDLDRDGQIDGHVVLLNRPKADQPADVYEVEAPGEPPVTIVGMAFDHPEIG